jgi:ComEC/Rec2-related protein
MAVSGAQLSIICSYAVIVMEMLRVGRFKRFGVCLLLIAFFLMICEDSVSITRAAIMIIITFAVPLLNRQSDTATSLAISVIILTVENPLIIGDASFLLSVGGVLAVAVISPPVISRLKTDFSGFFGKFYMQIRDIFISSLIVSLTLFPISFLFFNEISLLSPFTNILLIPISTLVIILGMFIVITGAFSPLAALLFPTISLLCKLTALISEFAASLPFASIPTGYDFERPLIVIFIAAALFIGIFSKNGKKLKITLTVLFASFAFFICAVSLYRIIPSERLYAAVLGDERGAAVVIHDKSNAIVIDLKGSGEAAPAVYKYLSSIGIEDISAVITRSGAVRAIPAYMEHLPSLYYPVKLFAAPKSLRLPESVVFPNDSGIFYDDEGGYIEYENIHTEFYENSVIITLNGDYTVIISDSEEITLPPDFDKPPNAIIYISGELFTKQGNEEIIAALDSSAAVSADTITEVFIGKSIRLDDKGNVKIIY